jgi:hypothetical protein
MKTNKHFRSHLKCYKYRHRLCISTATVVARTHLNVTLYTTLPALSVHEKLVKNTSFFLQFYKEICCLSLMTLKNYFFKLIMHVVHMHTNKRFSCRKMIFSTHWTFSVEGLGFEDRFYT